MKFTDFQLNAGLLEGIGNAGYENCMPVQEQVLTKALDGADLYVQSQTGTGKTAAYLITIIERLSADDSLKGKNALIMVPTRELAVQVEEEARVLCSGLPLKVASFYGGVGYKQQQELLRNGTDILVGTPGRVIDLQQSGAMNLNNVAFLVIDEADRMFDMGFYPDLRTLIKVLPIAENRQTMLFSATLNTYVKNLAWEYTIDAVEVNIEPENMTVTEIDQELFHVSADDKVKLLLGIFQREQPESIIVFCNTKRMCEVLAKRLKINGIETEFIIGDLPQTKRLQVIDSFKRGSLKCLVATDVAARGIDVNDLSMVVNYDLPNEAENYVHRIGRTARAGKTGKAYTLCCELDVYNLAAIEKYIEAKIPSSVAWADMMAEDKSAGTYIRTEFGHDDDDRYDNDRGGHSDHSRHSRRDGGRNDHSGHSRRDGKSDHRGRNDRSDHPDSRVAKNGNRDNSAYSRKNRNGTSRILSKGTRRDQVNKTHNNTIENTEKLASLSFEERMAIYKSRYGATSTATNGEDSHKKTQRSHRRSESTGNTQRTKQTGPSNQRCGKNGRVDHNGSGQGKYKKVDDSQKRIINASADKKQSGIKGFFKRIFGKRGK